MKYWFVWALAALMVFGAEAAEKKAKGKDKGKGNPIAKIDADKDGKVSLEEFVADLEAKAEKADKEFDADAAEAAFEKKDKDGDGFLTAAEMAGGKKGPKKSPGKGKGKGKAKADADEEDFGEE